MSFRRSALKSVFFVFLSSLASEGFTAEQPQSHVKKRSELDYGPVLYEFYQRNYFNALVENEYALGIANPQSKSTNGQLLKGGMLLNYGLPSESMALFGSLLNKKNSPLVRNKAWFHLSKLYYQKSEFSGARRALDRVKGELPPEMHIEYHYLASLVGSDGLHTGEKEKSFAGISKDHPQYTYLVFNTAVAELRRGRIGSSVLKLEEVAKYTGSDEELLSLADRARHGLAQMAAQAGDQHAARAYLTGIRTTGLYSNRALLSYAWASIKLKQFEDAIPALQMLDSRSITIPEVQESKVLLAHLYEQEGSPRKALRANLLAEKAFKKGTAMVADARKLMKSRSVPREFIVNLDAIVGSSDWYRTSASVDYRKLTPFLIDLMSSNVFHDTLKDLAALYSLENNLDYWWRQTTEHQLILANARKKDVVGELKALLDRTKQVNEKLLDQKTEMELSTLSLSSRDRARFKALIQTSEQELSALEDKIIRLNSADQPYAQPANYASWVKDNHKRLEQKLAQTRKYIKQLEPIMRGLINRELDKHEERMSYYWAQSRLAKARLYDTTLLELENARPSEPEIQAPNQGE